MKVYLLKNKNCFTYHLNRSLLEIWSWLIFINISLRSLLSSNKLEIEYNGLLKDSSFFLLPIIRGFAPMMKWNMTLLVTHKLNSCTTNEMEAICLQPKNPGIWWTLLGNFYLSFFPLSYCSFYFYFLQRRGRGGGYIIDRYMYLYDFLDCDMNIISNTLN